LFDFHLLDEDLHFLDSHLWICALGQKSERSLNADASQQQFLTTPHA